MGEAFLRWTWFDSAPNCWQWRGTIDRLGYGGVWAEGRRWKAHRLVFTVLSGSAAPWYTAPRGDHSAKPDLFLDLIERMSPPPRLELFARRQRLGWDTWGDEALEHVEMKA